MKSFHDLPEETKKLLYKVYLPKFTNVDKRSYVEIYNSIRKELPYSLGESAIRKNLKERYRNEKETGFGTVQELMQEVEFLRLENKGLRKEIKEIEKDLVGRLFK